MHRTFTLGVCAMENKVESSPMKAILKLLEDSGDFNIIIFPEKMILDEPITKWPVVQCLIAFYSFKYPLEKAIEYVKLVKPVFLNDLEKQMIIRSRIDIYRELQACRIPHPNYLLVDHDLVKKGVHTFEEHYDYIIYNNVRLNKPFIEKPIDSEDHNNWIYYPSNAGGGCKKLFRKVQDRSSEYCPDIHNVRRNGTYIYEEFMSTFGTDIKVYAVGTMFAHAEARKSPSLDGKVNRYSDGKEVRYPVILTSKEKTIAYRIVDHFGQIICGFDILRTFDGPYVCDVNGWSFVKRNKKYHIDCSQIIRAIFLLKLQAKYNILLEHVIEKKPVQDEVIKKTFADPVSKNLYSKSNEELCSVIVVMRHADRKPKSKLKFYTKHRKILEYFKGRKNESEIKLKAPEELEKLSQINQSIILEMEDNIDNFNRENQFLDNKLSQELNNMIVELNYHRHFQKMLKKGYEFSGINRKVQLKPVYKQNTKETKVSEKINKNNMNSNNRNNTNYSNKENENNENNNNNMNNTICTESRFNWSGSSMNRTSYCSSKWDRDDRSDRGFDNSNMNSTTNTNSNDSTDVNRNKDFNYSNNKDNIGDIREYNNNSKNNNRDDGYSLFELEQDQDYLDNIESVLVIAKWGGDLTDVGKLQAEDLGRRLRQTLYPVEGSGLIRLHSTFRHDFKIFSSDEGRCQITSAAFTKGILDLEGELTPILVAMTIRNKKAYELLNDTKVVKERDRCRNLLNELITKYGTIEYEEQLQNMPEDDRYYYNKALVDADYTKDDLSILSGLIREYIKSLKKEEMMWNSLYSVDDYAFHIVNSLDTIQRRWNHLLNKFHISSKKSEKINNNNNMNNTNKDNNNSNKENNRSNTNNICSSNYAMDTNINHIGSSYIGDSTSGDATPVVARRVIDEDIYDCTKLSDIVDNIRYDLIHMHYLLGHGLEIAFEIYSIVERLSSVISPCEYGVTPKEKLKIGTKIAWNLLQKILHDVTYQRVCMNLSAENVDEGTANSNFGSIPTSYFDNPDNPTGNFDNTSNNFDQIGSNFDSDIDFMLNNDTSAASIAATSLVRSNTYLDSNKLFENGSCFIGGIKPTEMYLFGNNTNTENIWTNMSTYKTYTSISEDENEKNKIWLLNSYSLWAHTKMENQMGTNSILITSKDIEFDSLTNEDNFIGNEKIPFDNNLVSLEKNEANNLGIKSPQRMVRSRYYVTSASHLFSIFNFFKYAHLLDDSFDTNLKQIENIKDLHYLSHIVLRVWRSKSAEGFFNRLEILVSSGAKDGFGQNYDLLEKNTKNQKNKYKRHVQRYKLQRIQSTNCIACPFTLGNLNKMDSIQIIRTDTNRTLTPINKEIKQTQILKYTHSLDTLSYPERSIKNILDVYNLMTGNLVRKKFKCYNCFLAQYKSLNSLILSTRNFHMSTSLSREGKEFMEGNNQETHGTLTTGIPEGKQTYVNNNNKEEKENNNNNMNNTNKGTRNGNNTEIKDDNNTNNTSSNSNNKDNDRRSSYISTGENTLPEESLLTNKTVDEDGSFNIKEKAVPPYCELNTLVIMNRNFGLDRLRNFIEKAYEQIILNH